MLGIKVNSLHEERFSNFYEYIEHHRLISKSTFVVDENSNTFLIAQESSSTEANLIYLKGANLSQAEVYRLLNYQFEGHILPEISDSELSINNLENSALEISFKIKNIGKVPLAGLASKINHIDRIRLEFYQDSKLVDERIVDFPYRIIKPDEEIVLHSVLDQLNFMAGDLKIELGLYKEGYGWCTEKDARSSHLLKLDQPFRSTQVDLSQLKSQEKIIAFTFDGGGNPPPSRGVLDILEHTGIKATFFLTGNFILRYPDFVREIVEAGHELANHTLSHPRCCFFDCPENLPAITQEFLESELRGMENTLSKIGDFKSSPIWRAPFGAKNSRVIAWAYELGYTHIFWNYDSHDWRIPDTNQPEWTGERMLKSLSGFLETPPNGSILLFHTGVDYSQQDLKEGMIKEIENLKGRGYRFVRVGDVV